MPERTRDSPGDTFVWILLVTLSVALLASIFMAFVAWEGEGDRFYLFRNIFPVFAGLAAVVTAGHLLATHRRRQVRTDEIDGMTAEDAMLRLSAPADGEDGSLTVLDLARRATPAEDGRILVFDLGQRMRYVLRDASLWRALAQHLPSDADLSLASYLAEPEAERRAASFASVSPATPLRHVAQMLAGGGCREVVVTHDGSRGGVALGLITDASLGRLAAELTPSP